LRRVARKRLIRTAALRRRDHLALTVLGYHTDRDLLANVRTDIEWAPVLAPALAPSEVVNAARAPQVPTEAPAPKVPNATTS
jgi:hypothetical protein